MSIINTVVENTDMRIIIFLIFISSILHSKGNSAVRKQWRIEDDYWDTRYLSFWSKLIFFPRFLFSQKPFKNRTIKFRKITFTSFIIALLICLLPIDLRIRAFIPIVYLFWFLFLAIIFEQQYRGL